MLFGQQDSTWGRWHGLIGDWVGEGSGEPGQGTGWFSFTPELGGGVLLRRSHSEYPATKDNPGTIHNDLMVVYLHQFKQPAQAIYFDNEGHVIHYTIAYAGSAIVLTSDKVQNAPVFRLTYVPVDSETVNIMFEMSRDGEKFLTYTEGTCKKRR
jgi:hypothetical protein